jgi:hypothetical protein
MRFLVWNFSFRIYTYIIPQFIVSTWVSDLAPRCPGRPVILNPWLEGDYSYRIESRYGLAFVLAASLALLPEWFIRSCIHACPLLGAGPSEFLTTHCYTVVFHIMELLVSHIEGCITNFQIFNTNSQIVLSYNPTGLIIHYRFSLHILTVADSYYTLFLVVTQK